VGVGRGGGAGDFAGVAKTRPPARLAPTSWGVLDALQNLARYT
jgi:hypothetical protein